ncbi:type II secretion system protein [Shewanella halifaxensis]|uniref:type II secretion system protein n=1 Tax=Shewanella halifaxensis TaxID=271098 RepID=UPI000D59056B|nr:type II secretion system protein [Shewanella halifaxensis]
MQKQNGFTLIELVVVIIILGILAVTAAPKFINLQGDARLSTLQGMKGAIQSANSLLYSKAAIGGSEKDAAADASPIEGVTLNFGYIQATKAELEAALDITSTDWVIAVSDPVTTPASVTIQPVDAPDTCVFTYQQAKDASTPPVYGTMPDASDC